MRVLEAAPRAVAREQARSHLPGSFLRMVLACTVSLSHVGCGGNANGGNANGGNGGTTQGQLVGTWLGPVPGDAGLCGVAVGTWSFSATGSYTFHAQFGTIPNSAASCADYLLIGTYSAQGNAINFNQQQVPNCPPCPQTAQYGATYSFISTNDLQLCDGPQCFLYHRQ